MKKNILGLLLIIGISTNLVASDRFVRDDTKEVVVDSATNLMWQDDADAKSVTKTWEDAIDYCDNLTLGGYSNWHLPNYNELWGVADRSRVNLAIDPAFKNVVSNYYWSSSTLVSDASGAWGVYFNGGYDFGHYKSVSGSVRCVRDNN